MSRPFWLMSGRSTERCLAVGRTPDLGHLGFTLIEMLMAFALFSMAMAALVGGLYSGVRSWRTLTAHQLRQAELDKAVAQLQSDFRGLCIVSKEEPALSESDQGGGADSITLCTLGTRFRQRAGMDTVWRRVSYALRKRAEGGEMDLVRTETPYIGSQALDRPPTENVVLSQTRQFSVKYVSADGVSDSWEDGSRLPAGVQIDIQSGGGRPVRVSIQVPCGLLAGRG